MSKKIIGLDSTTAVFWHGLVWSHVEVEWKNKLKDYLLQQWLWWFLNPDLHTIPYQYWHTMSRWITVWDLVSSLQQTIYDNTNPNNKLVFIVNSMSSHIFEILIDKNDSILDRLTHYIYISWCSLWVEHGNEDFNEFMKRLTAEDKKWIYALANGIKAIMDKESLFVGHVNEMLRFGISKCIGISEQYIGNDMIERTKKNLWSYNKDGIWISNNNISSIAVWLPRKQSHYDKTLSIHNKLIDKWVKSMVVWSINDPMVKWDNIEKVADNLGTKPMNYIEWWHAVHLSPNAKDFTHDLIEFLKRK